jgi:hypothetical protein
MLDLKKIRMMTPEQRIMKFKGEADNFLDKYQCRLVPEVKIEKALPNLDEGEVTAKLQELEQEYNVKIVPELQIRALYYPDEMKKMQEDDEAKKVAVSGEIAEMMAEEEKV